MSKTFQVSDSSSSRLSDRTWPLPKTPWVMRMRWEDLLFAHWQVDANHLRALLPEGLELDTREGAAWIGVVPFRMSDVAPRFVPAIPWVSAFPELNVRTYVTLDEKPGVWFFSLDATNPLAVRLARATFSLPYMDARMLVGQGDEGQIRYRSQRTHRGQPAADFEAAYFPTGEPFLAQPGTLEHWLTARYCLYAADRSGTIFRGEIDHPPWQLQPASCELEANTMCDSYGMRLCGEPHLLFSRSIDVRAWMTRRC